MLELKKAAQIVRSSDFIRDHGSHMGHVGRDEAVQEVPVTCHDPGQHLVPVGPIAVGRVWECGTKRVGPNFGRDPNRLRRIVASEASIDHLAIVLVIPWEASGQYLSFSKRAPSVKELEQLWSDSSFAGAIDTVNDNNITSNHRVLVLM